MKRNILIVDDETSWCRIVENYLHHENYRTKSVNDYDSALLAAGSADYDAIILDIVLEGQNGLDILRNIREKNSMAPIIMVTGNPTIENASECIRLGAFDYLTKPVEKEILIKAVNLAVNHRRLLENQMRLEKEIKRQKQLYQSIVEDQTEFICRFTSTGILTFINQAYADYLGMAAEEFIGEQFSAYVRDEEENQKFKDCIKEINPGSFSNDVELRMILSERDMRWHRWIIRGVFDDDSELIEYQAVGRDITVRKSAEKELMEYQLKLEAVFQNIPEGLLAVDSNYRIIQKNQSLDDICMIARIVL